MKTHHEVDCLSNIGGPKYLEGFLPFIFNFYQSYDAWITVTHFIFIYPGKCVCHFDRIDMVNEWLTFLIREHAI